METLKPNLKKIKSIAWALSLASGKQCLDVPGEYTWAYPGSINKKKVIKEEINPPYYNKTFTLSNNLTSSELITIIHVGSNRI